MPIAIMLLKATPNTDDAMDSLHQWLFDRAEESARSDPLVFVGRDREITKILQAGEKLPPGATRSQTVLVEGPPGSGKTSLLTHLANRFQASSVPTGTQLRWSVPAKDADVAGVYGNIAADLAAAPSPDVVSTTQRTIRGGANFGVAAGDVTRATTEAHPAFQSAAMIAGWGRVKSFDGWAPKNRAVLFVDEVQEVAPGEPGADLLKDLHTQGDIPVLLVCAGLGNSERRLSDAGLSRIENVLTLGRLQADETVECAERTLREGVERGVRGTDADLSRWARGIARAADDWPRHLHVYLQAAWRTLFEQDAPDLGCADMDAAIRVGDLARQAYYQSRIGASKTPVEITKVLYERIARDGSLSQEDAWDTLREAVEHASAGRRAAWREQFDSISDGFAELLRAGVISLDTSRRCRSPIPSFSRFVLDGGGPAPAPSEAPRAKSTQRAPSPNRSAVPAPTENA